MPVAGGEPVEEPCVIASRSCRNDGDLEQQIDDDEEEESHTGGGGGGDDGERVSTEERATASTGSEPDGTERPQDHHHHQTHNTDASASTGSSAENSFSFSGNMIPTVFARVLDDSEDNRGPVVMIETNNNGGAANEDAPTGINSRSNTSPVPTRTEDARACAVHATKVVLWLTLVVTVITILSTVVLPNIGIDDDDDDDHGPSQSPSASPSTHNSSGY